MSIWWGAHRNSLEKVRKTLVFASAFKIKVSLWGVGLSSHWRLETSMTSSYNQKLVVLLFPFLLEFLFKLGHERDILFVYNKPEEANTETFSKTLIRSNIKLYNLLLKFWLNQASLVKTECVYDTILIWLAFNLNEFSPSICMHHWFNISNTTWISRIRFKEYFCERAIPSVFLQSISYAWGKLVWTTSVISS